MAMQRASKLLTRKTRLGMGVKYFRFIIARLLGRWPLRAPTKKSRDEAKIPPFKPPNVDSATERGIIHEKLPSIRLPNVTATAFEVSSSCGVSTVKYATLANR